MRSIGLVLALILALTVIPSNAHAAGGRFSDDDFSGHEADIEALAHAGITQGCTPTTFCPAEAVTRGQMAAFLHRSPLGDTAYTHPGFTDTIGHPFAGDIAWLAGAGITQGCDTDRFCPDDAVTRAQMAAFLTRALDLPPPAVTGRFTDTTGHFFADEIDRLATAGITLGCTPTTFCPDQAVTRAQMATFLVRAFQLPPAPQPVSPLPPPIDDGVAWERTLHVSTSGSQSGDGTSGSPFATVQQALAAATPGTRILVAPGTYGPFRIDGVAGAPGRPIGVFADGAVTIDGGGTGSIPIAGSDPSYLVIDGFRLTGATIHGMNIDDGGSYDTPAHHLVLRNLTIAGAGSGGNNDCIKLSGVDDFWVLGSDVSGCNQGEIIDMVGSHRGVISGNHFHDTVKNGVQTKGGSSDTIIHGNLFERIPGRAVNAGGSTGSQFLRPTGVAHEAANITVVGNVFVENGEDSGAAIAFVGCDACTFANNTVIEPQTWVARILQETVGLTPSRNGRFVNNLVVLRTGDLRTFVNIGPDTLPETFVFADNLWFALDEGAGWTGPTYCCGITATGAIVQQDPLLVDSEGGNYRLQPASPAIGAGAVVSGIIAADFDGSPFSTPPSIGAFEYP